MHRHVQLEAVGGQLKDIKALHWLSSWPALARCLMYTCDRSVGNPLLDISAVVDQALLDKYAVSLEE